MKLPEKEFKLYCDLAKKVKSGKATDAEKAKFEELDAKKRGTNDIAWWDNYPALTDSVKNIAFNYLPGTGLDVGSSVANSFVNYRWPGVAVAKFKDAIGLSEDTSDGFNAQMRQLWLDMHRKYRGIGAYQRSDLGMAIIAIISFFESVLKFERIYGVLNTYKIMNRNVPYTILEALRISDSVSDDLANFRYELNQLIEKSRQLCLPSGLAILDEKARLLSNIFKDSDSKRAALFMYDNVSYGLYDPTLITTGGCVKFVDFTASMTGTTPGGRTAFRVSDMITILKYQLNALIDDDDIAKICSDLLAVYGPENVSGLALLPEDYRIEAAVDEERKLQFHNLTICGGVSSFIPDSVVSTTLRNTLIAGAVDDIIWQENNVIKDVRVRTEIGSVKIVADTTNQFNFLVASTGNATTIPYNSALFDVWKDVPDKAEIICGSRFTVAGSNDQVVAVSGSNYHYQFLTGYGTEIVTEIDLYTKMATAGYYVAVALYGTCIVGTTAANLRALMSISHFDWHPLFVVFDSSTQNSGQVFGDVDNVTVIRGSDLQKMHDNCVYSIFKIPQVTYIKD